MEHLKGIAIRILAALSALLLTLSVALAVVLNSGVIDNWAREAGTALFNKELRGRLEVERVELKFPDRIVLYSPKLYEPGEKRPALEARRLSARFNILSLLQPELTALHFRRISADSLQARLLEREDGTLNVERIFAPRVPDSTRAGIEAFSCRRLRLHGSALSYTALKEGVPTPAFSATGMELALSSFSLQEGLTKGTLEELSFTLPKKSFRLSEGSARFLATDRRLEIIGLRAAAGGSRAALSVSLDDLDIFHLDPEQVLRRGISFVNLESLTLESRDLETLFPSLRLPEGTYTLKGDLKGNRNRATLLRMRLTHNGSDLKLKGDVMNLLDSETLAYRLKVDSSRVSGALLGELAPEGALREAALRSGGLLFSGTAEGTLNAVKSDLAFASGAGRGTLQASVGTGRKGALAYRGALALEGFEPHRLFAMDGAESTLNLKGTFSGTQGTGKESEAKADVTLSDSFWHRQPIGSGRVKADWKSGRLQFSAAFDDLRSTKLTLEGVGDFRPKDPRYRLKADMQGIDLARLLPGSTYATDISGLMALEGAGFDPSSMNAALTVQFRPSSLNGLRLPDGSRLSAALTQSAGSSTVTLKSDFLDLSLSGNYSLEQLSALAGYAASGVRREVARENIWERSAPPPLAADPLLRRPFTVNYSVNVKESAPLELLLPLGGVSFRGSAVGRAVSSSGTCSLTSSVDVPSLELRGSDTASGTALDRPFTLGGLNMQAALECSGSGIGNASLTGRVGALDAFGRKTGNASFTARYAPSSLSLKLRASVPDPDVRVEADIRAVRTAGTYRIAVGALSLADSSGSWGVAGRPVVQVERRAMRFERFTMQKGTQRLVLDGALGSREEGRFTASLSGFELSELQRFTLDPSLAPLSGTVDLSLGVEGSPASKSATLDIRGRRVRYERFLVGNVDAALRHRGEALTFTMRSGAQSEAGGALPLNTITGSGTVPLKVSYFPLRVSVPERRPVSASFDAPDLSAQVLEFALPFFASAEGRVPTTLRVRGRTPSPEVYLESELRGTRILVAPTEVAYTLDGALRITPQQLELRDLRLQDREGGTGSIQGTLKLRNLEPGALSVTARLQDLLLYDKQDKKDETSFGTIVGSSPSVRLSGDIASPVLEGQMRINRASFSLYRSRANESAKYVGAEKFIEFVPRHPAPRVPDEEKQKKRPKDAEFYYSLIDILEIRDFKLSGQEPMRYTMIFDRLRGEQLETTVNNLSLIVSKHNQRYRLFGSVQVAGGKYRFSNSNFDLESGGRISWNNDEIRDGAITDLYGSKFVSALYQPTAERDNVKLLLAITGTINEPRVAMGYYLNETAQPYAATTTLGSHSAQIDPNAELNVISMLLSRQWYIRPGSNGVGGGGIAASSVGLSAGTGLLSAQVSSAVRNLAGLESFNLNVGTGQDGALTGLDLYFAMHVPGTGGKLRFIGTGSSTDIKQSSLFGEYGTSQKLEYRITPKVSAEAYRSYGQTSSELISTNLQKPTETWGVSLSYKERFHTWDQFWRRLTGTSKQKEREKEDSTTQPVPQP